MIDFTDVTLRMDPKTAEKIIKNGKAEIVTRTANARFKAMTKYSIVSSTEKTYRDILGDIISKPLYAVDGNNAGRTLRMVDQRIVNISDRLKFLSSDIDSLYMGTQLVSKLSFLNAALSTVNLGVTVAGFIMIKNDLQNLEKTLNKKLDVIVKNTEDLKNLSKNELKEQVMQIIMTFNTMTRKLTTGQTVSLDEQDEFVNRMNGFCRKILDNIRDNTLNTEVLLELIFPVLPAYSSILQNYIYDCYMETKMLPPNYEIYMSLYDLFFDKTFEKSLYDCFFLEKNLSSLETANAINVIDGIVLKYATEIMDRVELIKVLKTKQAFKKFEENLDQVISEEIESDVDKIAEMIGKKPDQCQKALKLAYKHFRDSEALKA